LVLFFQNHVDVLSFTPLLVAAKCTIDKDERADGDCEHDDVMLDELPADRSKDEVPETTAEKCSNEIPLIIIVMSDCDQPEGFERDKRESAHKDKHEKVLTEDSTIFEFVKEHDELVELLLADNHSEKVLLPDHGHGIDKPPEDPNVKRGVEL